MSRCQRRSEFCSEATHWHEHFTVSVWTHFLVPGCVYACQQDGPVLRAAISPSAFWNHRRDNAVHPTIIPAGGCLWIRGNCFIREVLDWHNCVAKDMPGIKKIRELGRVWKGRECFVYLHLAVLVPEVGNVVFVRKAEKSQTPAFVSLFRLTPSRLCKAASAVAPHWHKSARHVTRCRWWRHGD